MINDQAGDHMTKYIIKIQETLSKEYTIHSENEKDALNKIKQLYESENIVLYSEECDVETTFQVEKEEDIF